MLGLFSGQASLDPEETSVGPATFKDMSAKKLRDHPYSVADRTRHAGDQQ
jgi:hypothetical protein